MIDLFIIIVALWALFSGWRAGVINELMSTFGILVGLLIAATCYRYGHDFLAVNGSETNMVTSIIAFLLLWIIVPIALGFMANVLTRSLKTFRLGMPNAILGAVVCLLKYLVILSCVFNVMQELGIMNQEKVQRRNSTLPWLVRSVCSSLTKKALPRVATAQQLLRILLLFRSRTPSG